MAKPMHTAGKKLVHKTEANEMKALRIVAVEGDCYKVFWIGDDVPPELQFGFYSAEIIDHFYQEETV